VKERKRGDGNKATKERSLEKEKDRRASENRGRNGTAKRRIDQRARSIVFLLTINNRNNVHKVI